jgi:GntR family transcriptional regulator
MMTHPVGTGTILSTRRVAERGETVTNGSRPLHRQIADDLRARVRAGEYAPGDWLASESTLQQEYEASRNTVRSALKTLISEGLISSSGGRGYAVRDRSTLVYDASASERRGRRKQATHDIWITDVQDQGRTPGMRLDVTATPATTDIARLLDIEAGEQVIARRRIRLVDDEPYSISTAYWPMAIAQGTPIEQPYDMQPGPLAWLAEHGQEQVRVCDQINSRMPTPEEVDILRLQAGTPVTDHVRTGYDVNDKPLRVTVTILPGDRFILRYELTTDD